LFLSENCLQIIVCLDVVLKKSVLIVLIFRIIEFRALPKVRSRRIAVHDVRGCGVTGLQDFFLSLLTSFSPLSRRRLKVLLKNKCAVSHYVRSRALFRHVLRTFSVTFTVAIMNNHERTIFIICTVYSYAITQFRSNCFHDATWVI